MIRTVVLAAMLVGMLSVAGCGGSGAQEGSSEGSSEGSGGKEVGEDASDFTATTLQGDEFNLAEKRGEVVALFFMAGY